MIIGWLSPAADLIECSYMDHLAVAEDICKDHGIDPSNLADNYLLEHGWVKLTMTTLGEFGWNIIFPFNDLGFESRLSQAQHEFLEPLILENKNLLTFSSMLSVSREFEDVLYEETE